jgi:hypothetical protein
MVLTKEQLIGSLQNEIRILLHLITKIEPSYLEYRPTAKQRSTLELLRYLAIMGPTQIGVIKEGVFTQASMAAAWGPAQARSSNLTFEEAVAAIGEQSAQYADILSGWTDADFASEVDVFGNKSTRGALLVTFILTVHAAYRMQLFCYLKSCGREELNTLNLWMGIDGSTAEIP